MVDSTTGTVICTRLAAQDRHGPKESVPLALSTFGPRRPASTIRAHLTAPAAEPTISGSSARSAGDRGRVDDDEVGAGERLRHARRPGNVHLAEQDPRRAQDAVVRDE